MVYDYKNWKKVASHLPGRSEVQCLHRWSKVLNPDIIKTPWTKEVLQNAVGNLIWVIELCADIWIYLFTGGREIDSFSYSSVWRGKVV